MILVIGGAFQGKKEYVKKQFALAEEDFADGAVCGEEDLYRAGAVLHFHEYIRRRLAAGESPEALAALTDRLIRKNPDVILICNELGSGVVPVDAFDRSWRETTGAALLPAGRGGRKGLPGRLRNWDGDQGMREIILIRHGKTYGNTLGRYIGTTDEELCPGGTGEGAFLPCGRADSTAHSSGSRLCKPLKALPPDGGASVPGRPAGDLPGLPGM